MVFGTFVFFFEGVSIGEKQGESVDLFGCLQWLIDFENSPQNRFEKGLFEMPKESAYSQLVDSVRFEKNGKTKAEEVYTLDEESSTVRRITPGGRIWRVDNHVFRPAQTKDPRLFKISNLRVSPTFVSQEFAAEWKAANLEGLDFVEVWTDE